MSPDLIVIRHGSPGVPHFLARHLKAGVVNAGDGAHEHPTQALLDALTIRQRLGAARGPPGHDRRRHRSLARRPLEHLAPDEDGRRRSPCAGRRTLLPPRIEEMGVAATTDFDAALEGADVVMMLRMQLERQGKSLFPVDPRVLPALRPRRPAPRAGASPTRSSCIPAR